MLALVVRARKNILLSGGAIYVGTYPNDPATIAAVADVAERDARIV
jgi:hypothetical protein